MGIVYKAGKLLYHAGKVLTDCCIGACCVDGTCSQKSQCECQGTFQGVASTCDPNPCEGGGGSGACCLPDGTCTDQYSTQSECENCNPGGYCHEYLNIEPGTPCPDGWSGGDSGTCERVYWINNATLDESGQCAECVSSVPGAFTACFPDNSTTPPCGTWHQGKTCGDSPCGGACCLPDGTCTTQYNQSECEDCTPRKVLCADVIGKNEDGSCPDGYAPWGETLCKQEYEVSGCEECYTDCYVTDGGPCGTWKDGKTCAENPCDPCGCNPGDECWHEPYQPELCAPAPCTGCEDWLAFLKTQYTPYSGLPLYNCVKYTSSFGEEEVEWTRFCSVTPNPFP